MLLHLYSLFSAISRSLDSRFANYEENQDLIAATMLDPRYKNSLFKTSEEGSKTHLISIQNFLTDARKKMHNDQENYEENVSSASTDIEPTSENQNVEEAGASADPFDFDTCLNDLIASAESDATNAEKGNKKKLCRQSSSSSNTLRNIAHYNWNHEMWIQYFGGKQT